jgi:hypothetical protein
MSGGRPELLRAAETSRHVSKVFPSPHNAPRVIDDIVAVSTTIAVGTIVGRRCYLTTDGAWVVTVYRVRVTEAIRGPIVPDAEISVIELGGRIVVAENRTLQVRFQRVRPARDNQKYLLFLRQPDVVVSEAVRTDRGPAEVFQLSLVGYGRFELTAAGLVNAGLEFDRRDTAIPSLIRVFDGSPIGELLNDVKRAADRK